jgi:alkyl hydroperoxide reductase subunit AhpC
VLYFWTAASAKQNNFNVDFLKKLYDDYHKKGLDIYQVSLDTDKVMWATTVLGQDLPWTNVCDMRGAASPYAQLYNLQALPAQFIICNDELVDGEIVDNASFRKLIDKLLK